MQINEKYGNIIYSCRNYKGRSKIMPSNVKRTINDFIKKVKEILGDRVKKIILYGSYARGDFNKNSDVDIMILTDLNEKEIEEYRDKISNIVFEIQLEEEIYISPIIKNIDKYNERIKIIPFYMNVQKEGVEL